MSIPTILSCIWFGVLGGSALHIELENPGSIAVNGVVDTNSSIFAMLSAAPDYICTGYHIPVRVLPDISGCRCSGSGRYELTGHGE